ncbi:MAG: hypothetical protein EOO88_47270 [Pedobacter sp.]|nr:MAG: hypothetical protein EOO88_47270 [Pedobacter sp.]
MKKLLLFLLLCTLSVVELHAQQKPTIVLLMRHAEKATSGGADPELSDKGKEFADRLNLHFSELRIDAVYSTNYKRTRQTVEPLAKRSALEIKTYDPSKS